MGSRGEDPGHAPPASSPPFSVYQPVVDLRDGSVVAYEALARRWSGGQRDRPDRMFAEARAAGTVRALDVQCLRAALEGSHAMRGPGCLFVNLEPSTLASLRVGQLTDLAAVAPRGLRVVVEVTERDLLADPAGLLAGTDAIRDLGWLVALDDLGAEPAAVTLMPFLRPDVIKIDLRLVQFHPDRETATIINAVRAEAERTGAVVCAEGIETEEHLDRAIALGARLGQGRLYAPPGPLPDVPTRPFPLGARPPDLRSVRHAPEPGAAGRAPRSTPFELLRHSIDPVRTTVPLLKAMSRQIESQATMLDEFAVVLSAFQHARNLTPRTRVTYGHLAGTTALTCVFGVDMPDTPIPGVHGTAIAPDDPLTQEWVVVVITPQFAAALAARPAPAAADAGRQFDYVLTYDREQVLLAADDLVRRLRPAPALGPHRRPRDAPAGGASSLRTDEEDLPALLFRAIGTASNGITISDARAPDNPLVYVNQAFIDITGYPEREALGRNCRFLQGEGTDRGDVDLVARAIAAHRDVHLVLRNYRRDGTPFWNALRISPVRDASGEVTHFIGNQEDVTVDVERERRATYLAQHDELTGLGNRLHFERHVQRAIRRAARGAQGVGLVFVDLVRFKEINDTYGHAAGDAVLEQVARRFEQVVRPGDVLARIGGDEFVCVLSGLEPQSATPANEVARHIYDALREPLVVGPELVSVGASVGWALYPRDAEDAEGLLKHADAAMYRHKAEGSPAFGRG